MASQFTILVVEDEPDLRALIAAILSAKGFRILAVQDAYEARRILTEQHIDVLFTDIVMAGTDGVQLATQAKLMRPNIKVLFVTGYAQKATERGAMRLGKVLFKPLRQPEIIREVEEVLAA